MTKKVSIIIPVYKVEKYIAAAVQSVLNQTYENFELIIVDNDSPDRSIEICQQFDDPRIRIIRQENRGPSGSRNTGIRHATGDYLAFLDGDDLWVPHKIAQHVEHLNQNPQVGVSFCYSSFINENGTELGIYMTAKLNGITPGYVLCRCPMGNGSVSVYRREVFAAIAFEDNLYGQVETFYFDERMRNLEDVECWVRMALLEDWKIEGIAEPLTLYRLNNSGSSANVFRHMEYIDHLVAKVRSYAPAFMDTWEKPFRAYQLRFLARRMVTLDDGATATRLAHQAVATHWKLLVDEPKRTVITLMAAYLLRLLPTAIYDKAEALAMQVSGKRQRRAMGRQQTQEVAPSLAKATPEGQAIAPTMRQVTARNREVARL